MSDLVSALASAGRGLICQGFRNAVNFYKWLPFSDAPTTALAIAYAQFAQGVFCQDPPIPTGDNGRCPVRYAVVATYRVSGSDTPGYNGTFQWTFLCWGPVGAVGVESPIGTGANRRTRLFLDAGGERFEDGPQPPYQRQFSAFFSIGDKATVTILGKTVTVQPGYTDECPNYPYPDPTKPADQYAGNTTINYTTNNNTNISIPVGFVAGFAFVDVNGTLNIPITFTFSPNFNFNPGFQFDVDINFPIDGSPPTVNPPRPTGQPSPNPPPAEQPPPNRPPFNPGDDGDDGADNPPPFNDDDDYDTPDPPPPPPDDTPDPPPPPNPPPSTNRIRAAIVTVTRADPKAPPTIIGQGTNPDIFAPRLGSINFQIQVSGGRRGWTNDIDVKNKRSFVPCPWPGGAVSVAGTPQPGIEWTITPVYGKVTEA